LAMLAAMRDRAADPPIADYSWRVQYRYVLVFIDESGDPGFKVQ